MGEVNRKRIVRKQGKRKKAAVNRGAELRIRCFFWSLDPGSGMGKNKDRDQDPGSGINIPNHISQRLVTIFWG
jgi:hypothetical protein